MVCRHVGQEVPSIGSTAAAWGQHEARTVTVEAVDPPGAPSLLAQALTYGSGPTAWPRPRAAHPSVRRGGRGSGE